jgi:hypothetical protein
MPRGHSVDAHCFGADRRPRLTDDGGVRRATANQTGSGERRRKNPEKFHTKIKFVPDCQVAPHSPVKSAFYVTSPATAHLAKLYAMLTAYSILDVALFTERESAAKWLGVPVEVLMAQR